MASSSSSTFTAATSSPATSLGSKPAVLLIGGVTHAKKEWEECASFADLKVSSWSSSLGECWN